MHIYLTCMLPKESAKNRIKKMWNALKGTEKEEDLFPETSVHLAAQNFVLYVFAS